MISPTLPFGALDPLFAPDGDRQIENGVVGEHGRHRRAGTDY